MSVSIWLEEQQLGFPAWILWEPQNYPGILVPANTAPGGRAAAETEEAIAHEYFGKVAGQILFLSRPRDFAIIPYLMV